MKSRPTGSHLAPCVLGEKDRQIYVCSYVPMTSDVTQGRRKREEEPKPSLFLYIAIHNHDSYKEGRKRMYE